MPGQLQHLPHVDFRHIVFVAENKRNDNDRHLNVPAPRPTDAKLRIYNKGEDLAS